jgi:hypothetical protein
LKISRFLIFEILSFFFGTSSKMNGPYLEAAKTPGPSAKELYMSSRKKQENNGSYMLICSSLPETVEADADTHIPVIQAVSDAVSGLLSREKVLSEKNDKSKLHGYTVAVVPKTKGKKGFTAKVHTRDPRVGTVLLEHLRSVAFGSLSLQFHPAQSPTNKPDTYSAHYSAHLHGFDAFATEEELDLVPALIREITGLKVFRAQRLPQKGTQGRCPSPTLIMHIEGKAPATQAEAVYEVVVDEDVNFGVSYPNYIHLHKPHIKPAKATAAAVPVPSAPPTVGSQQQPTASGHTAPAPVLTKDIELVGDAILDGLNLAATNSPVPHILEDEEGRAHKNQRLDTLIEPLVLASPGFHTPASIHASGNRSQVPLLPTPSAPGAQRGGGYLRGRGGHTGPGPSTTPYNTRSRANNYPT